jgi:hypothetical protein
VHALRVHRGLRPGVILLLAVGLVASMAGSVAAASPNGGTANPAAEWAAAPYHPCRTSTVPAGYSGDLRVDGGPLNATAAAAVALVLTYSEEINITYSPNGTQGPVSCVRASVPVVTSSSGTFSGTIVPPAQSCVAVPGGGLQCTTTTGPFGPYAVAPERTPAGYGFQANVTGGSFALAWVADLARLALTPSSSHIALPPGAPRQFRAQPLAANGSKSPISPTFTWTLSGSGWSFAARTDHGSATVVAAEGARSGSLDVAAQATVGGNSFSTPTVVIDLQAVATALDNATVARTVVDANESDPVNVTVSGAPGYAYWAAVSPGMGLASSNVTCTTVSESSLSESAECATAVSYGAPGSATISVNVTNGYSAVSWSSPSVTVEPAPALSVAPAAPVGYVGLPLSVELAMRNGSGVPPYAEACFASGIAPPECSSAPGPTWTFTPTYSATGTYPARAWVVDAAGTNRSLDLSVEIVEPLALAPLNASSTTLAAGVVADVRTTIEGGALPAEAWWNASDLSEPIHAVAVASDGPLSVPFDPPATGAVRISLAVRDALGVVRTAELSVEIAPGPVASVVPTVPSPSSPVVVGHSVSLAWSAHDALGETVGSFRAATDLVVEAASGASAPAWVNVSGVGPLSSAATGFFSVPAAAWTGGELRANFTPALAGPLSVLLEGAALPNGSVTVRLTAAPDLAHLRLYAPRVELAGTTANRTLWQVSDRFGDPVPGTYVTIAYVGPSAVNDTTVPVVWTSPQSTGAWVNYSFPASASASFRLLDPAGDVLFGPVSLAPPPVAHGPGVSVPFAAAALGLAVLAGLGIACFVVWRTRPGPAPAVPLPTDEEAARCLAEGRAVVVEAIRSLVHADPEAIARAWAAEPVPPELDEWLASLVADGTLLAAPGPDGTLDYSLAPVALDPPRVTVDELVLERAVAAREAAVRENEPDPPDGDGPA